MKEECLAPISAHVYRGEVIFTPEKYISIPEKERYERNNSNFTPEVHVFPPHLPNDEFSDFQLLNLGKRLY